jgi:hypothetical protein
MYGIQQDEISVNMNTNTNVNVKSAAPFETVLVEPTLLLPVRDSFERNSEMDSSSPSSASLPLSYPTLDVSVSVTDKGKDAKEESFVSCFASTQEPKTKTIGVTAATAAIATYNDEIKKNEKLSPSHTDSHQQGQVVTLLNPATDIVLVPFTQGSENNADTYSGSDLLLYKIVCDYMEDVWSAGGDEDHLQLWEDIAAKVRFIVPIEQNQNQMQSQPVQSLSLSQSQQQQQGRFRKPNRRLPLCFQVQPVGNRGQPDNTDTDQHPNQYRVLLDAKNNVLVHSFLARAFGFDLEEMKESSPKASRTTRYVKAPAQQQHNYEGDNYKSPKAAPRRASNGTYYRPRGRPLLGYDWNEQRGLWVRVESDSDSENDSESDSGSASDSGNNYSLLLDASSIAETYSTNNANHKKKEEQNNVMPLTCHKSTRSNKAPIDALSMADISQVAALLADLRESSSSSAAAASSNQMKKSKNQNKAGASITTPASRSRRPVVVAKEGTRRGGRDGLISSTTSSATKPAPGKVQIKEEDAYRPVLQLVPKKPYHRYQDGTYVRPRGRAPSGKTWDVIHGIWVASNTTKDTTTTTSSSSSSSTAEPTGIIDTDSNDSSRTLGSDNRDDDNSSDTADGDCAYGDLFIDNSSGNNERRGAWVDPSWKSKTSTVASR